MEKTGDLRSKIFWVIFVAISVFCFLQAGSWDWLVSYPENWTLPVAGPINVAMNWLVIVLSGPLRWVSWGLGLTLEQIRSLLEWAPWSVTFCLIVITAHRAGGVGLTAFTFLSLLYVIASGYWAAAMNTLALVSVAVPLSVAIGAQIGIMAFRSGRLNMIVQPTLDVMQTVPAFAYLIPILLFFGFGPVVGLIASMIFAIPPMVRNTILGLQRVAPEILEAGTISGCNRRQLLWWVQIPSALPQLKIGVNQTTMAALSMVIIAAIIGGSDDVGWAVLNAMRKAQFGPSLMAGLVIALMAMMIDRISLGFARSEVVPARKTGSWNARRPHMFAAFLVLLILMPLSFVAEPLRHYPREWVWQIAGSISIALDQFIVVVGFALESIKRVVLFYFLLPFRIGLDQTISTYSWGIEFTPLLRLAYAGLVVILAGLFLYRSAPGLALAAGMFGVLFYFGTSGIPWPVFFAAVTALSYMVGGVRVSILTFATLLFILLNGLWEPAMYSVALCGAAILVAFSLGMVVGIFASEVDWVSKAIRPINDTLQTMPQFVYLIPVLMLFQVGDFSALIVVVSYAIVPAIRYTEHGLRSVSAASVEAGHASGCTRRQLLWWVKFPQAVPEIMLGLNQTVISALSMLVVAALVGTRGLGQKVYIALGNADSGLGLVTGISIALVAIITDRVLQSWSQSRKEALGLS